MIICAKYLMTGDGKTVLEDKAVLTKDGKIEKIASKEELTKAYPEEEVKDYGEATLLPGLCDMHAIWDIIIPSRIPLTMVRS